MGLLFQKLAEVKEKELVVNVLPGLEPRGSKPPLFNKAYGQETRPSPNSTN